MVTNDLTLSPDGGADTGLAKKKPTDVTTPGADGLQVPGGATANIGSGPVVPPPTPTLPTASSFSGAFPATPTATPTPGSTLTPSTGASTQPAGSPVAAPNPGLLAAANQPIVPSQTAPAPASGPAASQFSNAFAPPPPPTPNAIVPGQTTSTSTAPQGGVFDPGAVIKNATTWGEVDDKGNQILPNVLKGMLNQDGSQADMSTIAAMLEHPEVLKGMTPEQFQAAMGYAKAPDKGQIFANDPTRPGAGYVDYNGQPYRIEGTTAAGLDTHGGAKPMSGAKYFLQGPNGEEITGPDVNVDDYNAWVNGYHGPDNASGGSAAAGASSGGSDARTPAQQLADMTSQYVTPGRQTTANNSDPLSGVTTINPADDLRSTVITNTPDARTSSYADMTDQSAKDLAGVDRYQLAQDKFKTYADQTAPEQDLAIRKATQKAAAMGGMYGGQLTTDYGNLALARTRDLATERDKLFQSALDGSIQDQFNKTGALSSLEGTARGANDAATNALRGERSYQNSQEESAFERALLQHQTEQGDKQANFNNGVTLDQLGYAGNPGATLGSIANGMDTGTDSLAQFAAAMGKNNVGAPGAPSGPSGGGASSITGDSGLDSWLANYLSQQNATKAAGTAGQGIDLAGLEKLFNGAFPGDPGVQVIGG